MNSSTFSKTLLKWHQDNPRPMPWKNTSNPYYIWLSEIILQQTQVAQGWNYYEKFISHYPTIFDLANASEEKVLSDWQGLGYNSRARNLHYTAKQIANERNGVFPDTYEDILALKGVGPYTAAAIGSFAFGLNYPVVDGNVKRVIARIFGIYDSIDLPATHRTIEQKCQELFESQDPAEFNQAIMNFGAVQCTPKSTDCTICPFRGDCHAFQKDAVTTLPTRSPKKARKKVFYHYFVLKNGDSYVLKQRIAKDIWQHLFDFPVIETNSRRRLPLNDRSQFIHNLGYEAFEVSGPPMVFEQLLTHRHVIGTFYPYQIELSSLSNQNEYHLVKEKNLSNFALPKLIRSYFDQTIERE